MEEEKNPYAALLDDSAEPKKEFSTVIPKIGAGLGAYLAYKGGIGLPNIFKPGSGVFSSAPSSDVGLTPGEKWGQKTGYGSGKGTVREASEKFERIRSHAPVTVKTEKLYGVPGPGEPTDIYQRLLQRAKAKEAAQLAEYFKPAIDWFKGFGRIGLGGLGGYFSAKDAYELAEKAKKEGISTQDIPQVLSVLGGLASIGASPLAIAGGTALQGGLAAGNLIYDKFGNKILDPFFRQQSKTLFPENYPSEQEIEKYKQMGAYHGIR